MTTTTSYGTWFEHTGWSGAATLRQGIETSLSSYVADFDVDGIERESREQLAEALPDGITLNGDEFYGPAPRPENAHELIQAAIDATGGEEYWELVARHALRPSPLAPETKERP